MKYLILTVLLLSIFLISSCQNNIISGCTAEAKICPDGSGVGRSGPNCKFKECPALIYCGVNKSGCPSGFECFQAPEPYCIKPELACQLLCDGRPCSIGESYPAIAICE